jgi:ABC-2 type transport system permease protein
MRRFGMPSRWLAELTLAGAVARTAFRQQLAYRGAAVGGLVTNAVFGAFLASIYGALFVARDGAPIGDLDRSAALTYVWLAQALIVPTLVWGSWDIALSVRSGVIAFDLLKPYSYFNYWLSRDLGRAGAGVLMRMVPTLGIGLVFYSLVVPSRPAQALAFAVSLVLAVMLSFALRFCVNLIAFWWTDMQGLRSAQLVVFSFLSGFLLPIAFYPGWLQPVLNVLPFRGIIMSPIDVWLGNGNVVLILAGQAGWFMAVTVLAHRIFQVAVREVVVQGG